MKENKTDITKTYFLVHIHREDQAMAFFDSLYKDGLIYHPEDDALHIVNSSGHVGLFTKEQAMHLNERMDEVWKVMEDPCGYVHKIISE